MATRFRKELEEYPISKRSRLEEIDNSDVNTESPQIPNYGAFQQVISVVESGPSRGELKWPRGVTLHEDTGHIYVADMFNQRIQLFSNVGDYLGEFGNEHLQRPCGVLMHKDSIYVTDKKVHAVFQFTLPDFKMIKRVGEGGSGNEEFNSPQQLAISPEELLYIPDCGNNRVQVLDSTLAFQIPLRHHSVTQPVDVKFSKNQILVLSCWDKLCIHVFALSGEKLRSMITRGDRMQVKRPYFFCLDAGYNIVISDSSADAIKVFSLEGDLLHTVGEQGHQPGMLSSPSGIAILNQTKLVCASENCNYGLQIFST